MFLLSLLLLCRKRAALFTMIHCGFMVALLRQALYKVLFGPSILVPNSGPITPTRYQQGCWPQRLAMVAISFLSMQLHPSERESESSYFLFTHLMSHLGILFLEDLMYQHQLLVPFQVLKQT